MKDDNLSINKVLKNLRKIFLKNGDGKDKGAFNFFVDHYGVGNAIYDQGYVFFQQGDYEQSKMLFFALSLLFPFDYKYTYALAMSQQLNEDIDSAIESYWRSLIINPKSIISYYNIGECLLNNGDKKQAKIIFKKFLHKIGNDEKYSKLSKKASLMLKMCR